MMKHLATVALLVLFLDLALGAVSRGPDVSQRSSCPPVRTAAVDLAAYQGLWYTIATDVEFTRRQLRPDQGGSCVTANYTLGPPDAEGRPTIALLNCLYLRTDDQVACTGGRGFANAPGNLTVQVGPFAPPGPYLILDVFGDPAQGYRTALVYSCTQGRPGGPPIEESFFVLSRTPQLRFGLLELLFYLLRYQQRGIRAVARPVFYPQVNCKYFNTVPQTVDFFAMEPPAGNLTLQ